MRHSSHRFCVFLAGGLLAVLPLTWASAQEAKIKDRVKGKTSVKAPKAPTGSQTDSKTSSEATELNLLDAMRQGLVSAQAEGIGDGRITISVTNRTSRALRVVLPPGIVAQGATGQMGGMMGGMGGMGGGMGGMGGGMGGMGGGMGGMGGGMGGMGGGMGGMGGGMMGGGARTMPPMMGMMMLANVIMYFCGDYDSWDRRSLMMGMGGGGMMGGMGGMGGGMGGMGGGMGGMGGGMRSVPPTDKVSAELKPKQTRHLPTSIVSLTSPDPQTGVVLPGKGELLRIVGDIARVNDDPQVQKALERLGAHMVPASVSQLVMWRLAGGLDWSTIAQLSQNWANRYEMTLAQDFVDRMSSLPEGDSGRLLFQISGTDATGSAMATELAEAIKGKTVLGLQAVIGVPSRPEGPAVACQVRLRGSDALVQVVSSDGSAQKWLPSGKFSLPIAMDRGKFDSARFADSLAEGIISRLVRAQLIKGPREKGRLTYGIRIDNVSPLNLNGLAVLGTVDKPGEAPKLLSGISIPPQKHMTLPATEEAVKALGLKQGIRVMALDLSGL